MYIHMYHTQKILEVFKENNHYCTINKHNKLTGKYILYINSQHLNAVVKWNVINIFTKSTIAGDNSPCNLRNRLANNDNLNIVVSR